MAAPAHTTVPARTHDEHNHSFTTALLSQGGAPPTSSAVSRADVAEVVARSLLDPRACNVACTVTEADVAAPAPFEQDISKALEVLEPNQF